MAPEGLGLDPATGWALGALMARVMFLEADAADDLDNAARLSNKFISILATARRAQLLGHGDRVCAAALEVRLPYDPRYRAAYLAGAPTSDGSVQRRCQNRDCNTYRVARAELCPECGQEPTGNPAPPLEVEFYTSLTITTSEFEQSAAWRREHQPHRPWRGNGLELFGEEHAEGFCVVFPPSKAAPAATDALRPAIVLAWVGKRVHLFLQPRQSNQSLDLLNTISYSLVYDCF